MKKVLSQIDLIQQIKHPIPDIIHFVWIGDVNKANTNYISVWRKTNPDKKIYFWCEENSSLIDALHNSIHEYVLCGDFESVEMTEKSIKNDAYNYIYPKLNSGEKLDNIIVKFLRERNIPCKLSTKTIFNPDFQNLDVIARNIMELFTPGFEDFFRYYCYEIILRGNLASASDIVRLLIIYRLGGIYIDMDTLPNIDSVFHKTNAYLNRNMIFEDDFMLLMKTRAVLEKINSLDDSFTEEKNYNAIHAVSNSVDYNKVSKLIDVDMVDFSINHIPPLGKLSVHKNLLSLASLKRFKGMYFNNVIISYPGSKAVRIILRVMRKRYSFIEKNDCIFNFYTDDNHGEYLSRLLSWRSELITKNFCVTPILTGPGLIVEVLLGLAYSIFDLDLFTSPSFIAEYMQDENFGIAFYGHNLDTPEGMESAWRK